MGGGTLVWGLCFLDYRQLQKVGCSFTKLSSVKLEEYLFSISFFLNITRVGLSLHSLKLTWPLKIGRAPKGNDRIPNHPFSGAKLLVSGRVYLGSTPHPVTVANEGLQGSPTKNVIILVGTVTGRGPHPKVYHVFLHPTSWYIKNRHKFTRSQDRKIPCPRYQRSAGRFDESSDDPPFLSMPGERKWW